MTKFRSLLLAALTSLLVACPELGSQEPTTSGEIPENPTWTDVKPVLDRVCNDCHSNPPGDGGTGVPAPANIRLDVCETVGGILGAQSQAPRFVVRVIDEFPTPMPPTDYSPQPTPDEVELMRRWAEQGGTCEGSPNEPTNNQGTNNQTPNNSNNQPPNNSNNQTPNNAGDDMGMGTVDMGVDSGMDVGVDMAPAPTLAEIVDLLQTQCSECHGNNGGRGNLEILADATDMEVAMELTGTAMNPVGVPFITPNDPDQSAIYRRMDAGEMPPNEPQPDQAAIILDWINAGAPGLP